MPKASPSSSSLPFDATLPHYNQANYLHSPQAFLPAGEKLELVEHSLYDVLSSLNFGKSTEHPTEWFEQEQRRQRITEQIYEGIARFSQDQWFGILGLPTESSSFDLWLYPLFVYTLQNLLQEGHVYLFDFQVQHQRPYLRRIASTLLPLDAHKADPEQWLSLQQPTHPLIKWLQQYPTKAKAFSIDPSFLWEQGVGSRLSTAPSQWIAQPIYSLNKLSGLLVFARPEPSTASPKEAEAPAEANDPLPNSTVKSFLLQTGYLLGHYWKVEYTVGLYQQALSQGNELSMMDLVDMRHHINNDYETLLMYQADLLLALSHVVDARKGVKKGFSMRVAKHVRKLSKALHLSEKTVDVLERAALFTGVYRAFIPKEHLNQAGAWDAKVSDNYKKQLPHRQLQVLQNFVPGLGDCWPYLQFQFERWNGSGQPYGLRGWNIPLGSRILALCVAYTARLEPRRHRQSVLSKAEVFRELALESGKAWDPYLVDVLRESF